MDFTSQKLFTEIQILL